MIGPLRHKTIRTRKHLRRRKLKFLISCDLHEISPEQGVILNEDRRAASRCDLPNGKQVRIANVDVTVRINRGTTSTGREGKRLSIVSKISRHGGLVRVVST